MNSGLLAAGLFVPSIGRVVQFVPMAIHRALQLDLRQARAVVQTPRRPLPCRAHRPTVTIQLRLVIDPT